MKIVKISLFRLQLLAVGIAVIGFVSSCDKVDKIYPKKTYETELNTSLFPGDWQDYLDNHWPDFETTTASNQRNILIDDFTGHNCQYCPAAATVAHNIHHDNPTRVFVSSVHSSPSGITGFQAVTSQYPVDFTNPQALDLGRFFGGIATSGFIGNPAVGTSRIILNGSTEQFYPAGILAQQVSNALNTTPKVKLQSKLNYFESTKGAFLHTEVEVADANLGSLGMIIVLQQDSLISPQNVNGTYTPNYTHRDIHLGHLGNNLWGVTLTDDLKKENGKYYLDFSFPLPAGLSYNGTPTYDAGNMHILVYIYDKSTYEIYQVNKEKFQ